MDINYYYQSESQLYHGLNSGHHYKLSKQLNFCEEKSEGIIAANL